MSYNYCSNSDWFYDNDWSTCQNECQAFQCNVDYYTNEYCCPLVFSTRTNATGPWWIAIIFLVVFILAFVLSCWQMRMRRQRMLMMMGAQQSMMMGGTQVVSVQQPILQPAMMIQQPQQIYRQQPMMQQQPVMAQQSFQPQMNSQINMPAVM
ncbi:Hypothetical_protein [Hexamita inflata]|uniref:Hypothetical_protein n=1 Tax=Hexamita inflata TaxID=28002 RepID=A0AA86PQP0_9EUKA|nr:Hypothetical protein HINF_LOCUS27415 [Hexamita inflata]CAI9972163.1 Hypothetical protein HINF_LOCUS59808 [Hexamita inflata]